MQTQYERIRPIVFQKAPEVKQVRSNSLAIRSSPSKPTLNQSYESKDHIRDPLSELHNFKKLFVSESCHNKENSKKFCFKVDEVQYLQNRVHQLEQQNNNYIQENKKLAHMLDQQIQINQNLQEQHQAKNQIIKKLEESNNKEFDMKQINDQLNVYKKVVGDLEGKIKVILEENTKLSQERNDQNNMKTDLDKYKNRCILLENKLKQYQDENKILDFQRKYKKIQEENTILRQAYDQVSKECQQYQLNPQNQQDYKFKELIEELECQNQYMHQMMQIDAQKMSNLEDKLTLLTKENQRLTEIVKNRHKQ